MVYLELAVCMLLAGESVGQLSQLSQLLGFGSYNNQLSSPRRSRYQQYYQDTYIRIPPYNSIFSSVNSVETTTTTTTTTTTPPPPEYTAVEKWSKKCGRRYSNYKPQHKARRGRIIWEDEESAGAKPAPDGTFPWLASLFLRRSTGEAYFMCAAAIVSDRVLVSAAHCFSDKFKDEDWFVRVGDNYIAEGDPSEQTFQVERIIKHESFIPLSEPGGDGRNDIALLVIRPRKQLRKINFDKYVTPACIPPPYTPIDRWANSHCEIVGWGMQEYNNTDSYPDSVRAAQITVGKVDGSDCNYLYGRDVDRTGKFCAGQGVDACQEDSGGPLMCEYEGRYQLVGIVSSGKGCGSYPGLYTEVTKYTNWIVSWTLVLDQLYQ
ncbi:tryptase gamma [Eurytemora carolleeae]|uniref:tryptase gamma n=1 Tax=Eurytemora carolleeae TaxID=1294199 RepID=UPI000C76D56D|nr:tryptase gamma [Eurytemora carolleeae]|eukprot:XP_023345706.1 tryptase gamma-like [Eurytemora affinis]